MSNPRNLKKINFLLASIIFLIFLSFLDVATTILGIISWSRLSVNNAWAWIALTITIPAILLIYGMDYWLGQQKDVVAVLRDYFVGIYNTIFPKKIEFPEYTELKFPRNIYMTVWLIVKVFDWWTSCLGIGTTFVKGAANSAEFVDLNAIISEKGVEGLGLSMILALILCVSPVLVFIIIQTQGLSKIISSINDGNEN